MAEIVYHEEQTKCPYCGNEAGNITLLRSQTHEHKACRVCSKHYIVEQEFLAPFNKEDTPSTSYSPMPKCDHHFVFPSGVTVAECHKCLQVGYLHIVRTGEPLSTRKNND